MARVAVQGSLYTVGGSAVTIGLGFVRSVLMARFLLPDHYGTMTLAMVFVVLGNRLRTLGLDRALLHKQVDRGPLYATYLTLKAVTIIGSALFLVLLTFPIARFYPGRPFLRPVMIALILVTALAAFNQVQETLIRMHFQFGKLALVNVAASLAMLAVAPYLAWRGWGVWSLVAEQASGILMRALLLWGVWRLGRMTFGFDREAARWFWRFGRASWVGANTGYALDRFDDFWVGTALGNTALGYYNRAYEFARYPRRLLATSLLSVMAPVFARLQNDRQRLSRAYFRVISLLIRVGFLAGGVIVLLTPEFVFYLLGEKWMPMAFTLQLMALYMVLDPLLIIGNNLLFAVGKPEPVARVRLAQLFFFVPAVVIGARLWQINGVALAADAMLLLGLLLLHRHTRIVVTYSLFRMWVPPLVAGTVAMASVIGFLGVQSLGTPQVGWRLGAKGLLFPTLFVLVLVMMEWHELKRMPGFLREILPGRARLDRNRDNKGTRKAEEG
jgi:Membrane protein involved in the export of O-antigen and teichoic acid